MRRRFALIIFFSLLAGIARAQYDSTRNGKYKQFNDSQALVFEGRYKDGQRNGLFKEYDNSGLLISKARYKKGKLIWMQLYANGKIIEYIDKNGKRRKAKDCGC